MSVKKFIKEKILPIYSNLYAKDIYLATMLNNAIGRSAIGSVSRVIDDKKPYTWEFSGFSQNGEDGIIEYLSSALLHPNKYFIEIGTGNGLENNTSYLGHIKKYAGMQIEGNPLLHDDALKIKPWLVECFNWFVNKNTIELFFENALFKNPDVFSIDIDGIDYYIMELLLQKGLRPKIIVTEYNSAFGPEKSLTIPYSDTFNMFETRYPYLYYGVSLRAWKNLLEKYDYEFVSVESNGVNCFFVQPVELKDGFLTGLQKVTFKENLHQLRLFKSTHEKQYELIKDLPLVTI